MYCNVGNKYKQNLKHQMFFKKNIKCGQEYEKIFKEEESLEILKIIGLINSIEEYQKIYSHVRIKYKSIIYTEKNT